MTVSTSHDNGLGSESARAKAINQRPHTLSPTTLGLAILNLTVLDLTALGKQHANPMPTWNQERIPRFPSTLKANLSSRSIVTSSWTHSRVFSAKTADTSRTIEGMMTPDHTQARAKPKSTQASHTDPNLDTATEPSDEDEDDDNENPLVKRSHTTRLFATAASTPGDLANDTATEPKPDVIPATAIAPESIQLRYPSRTPHPSQQPSQPADEDEVVPETDPEILTSHAPRLANPRIYGSNRSHIRSGSALGSSAPSWHCAPTRPSKPKPKSKPRVAALREGAKRQLEQLVNPPNPVADARTDMVANATQRLKHLAMSTIGQKERQRGGKRLSAARNGKGIRGVDAGDDDEDEDDEEDEDEDREDEDGEDEDGDDMALAESAMVMVNNLATLKCNVKLSLRPVAEFIFKLKKPALTQADTTHNLNIIRYVYPLRFHCTDPWARRGHYEGLVIPRAIAAALFSGESSVGIMFHEFFDPVPIPTLA
ncbi:hypothetical protein FRC06_009456, partial [Ceratobasidium sp. 370]